jgi:hypothetical protein
MGQVAGTKKRRAERGVRIYGYVPPHVEKQVRDIGHEERRSLSDILTEALESWLSSRPGAAKGHQSGATGGTSA